MASFYKNLSNYSPTGESTSFQNIVVSGQVASQTAFIGSIKISTTNIGNFFDPDLLNLGTGLLTVNGNLTTAGLVDGINLQTLDTSVVKLTGDQTIAGNKTFSGNTTNSGSLTVSGSTALGTTTANSIDVAGLVEFNSLSGTGAVAITDIKDEDNMASNSETMLATQQSIKAYVDAQVDTADSLSEILAIGNATGGNNIAFGDSTLGVNDDRLTFGANADLQIYHDGSNNKSIIKENNNAANLQIQGENINITRTDGATSFIQTFDNKDVALYSAGNIKLKTSDGTGSVSAGINVTGTVTADGLTLGDNEAATFNGNLEIKSNGTESSITETGDGSLTIKGQNFVVKNSSNQSLIVGASSLQLYGAGVRKVQTVSTGIALEGTNGGGIVFREKDYDSTDANLDDTLSLKPTDDNWTGHKAITLPVMDGEVVVADSSGNVNVNGTATITTSGTDSCLTLASTASGSTNDAPELRLLRSSTPSADDQTGSIRFQSKTTGGSTKTYGRILSQVKDPSNTDYKGTIYFEVQDCTSGTDSLKNVMELEPDAVKIGFNETTTNLDVNGSVIADKVALADGKVAGFGTSEDRGNNWNGVAQGDHFDLEIRHDGSNSYIKDYGTGNLAIEAADLALRDNSNNRRVFCTDGAAGSVELYYGDSSSGSKLNTTATGINVTGTVTADALDIDGTVDIDTGNTIFDVDTGTSTVHFKSTNLGEQFLIENNNGGSTLEGAPDLTLFCNQPNDVADNDTLGVLNFRGLNDAGASYTYAKLFATAQDVSNGDEKGRIIARIQHASGGTDSLTNALEIHKDGIDVTGTVTADGITNAGAIANTGTLTNTGDVTIKSTTTGNQETPQLILERTTDDGAGVGFHDLGSIVAKGVDLANTNNRHTYAEIDFDAAVETAGSEGGRITFKTTAAGASPTEKVSVRNDAIYIQDKAVFQELGSTNAFTSLKATFDTDDNSIVVNLPSSAGTLALTSDIGFVAPTTVVGSAAISDMTSNISKKYVHTGGAVTLKFPNVTASSNLGNTWVVVNAGTDTLTFDRVTSGTSQFKQLNGSTVATAANTITLSKGGVAELTVTADNEIIIFGSGVI